MGEGDALALDQPDQHRRIVASGIDLLDAGERRRPGETPGMDMKHRRDRHVDIVSREAALRPRQAEQREAADRVQHELPVAVIDPLGQPGRTGRIEGRRLGVLVEIGKVVVGRSLRKQALILTDEGRLPVCGVGRSDITISRLTFGNCVFSPSSNPTNSSLTSNVEAPA